MSADYNEREYVRYIMCECVRTCVIGFLSEDRSMWDQYI